MKVFGSDIKRVPDEYRGGAAALGFFDGIHRGHLQLINEAIEISKEKGKASMLYTFDISPKNYGGDIRVFEITPKEWKLEVLEGTGLSSVFFDSFDEEMKSQTGEEFVKNVLYEKLGVTHVVVGFNYTFGVRASCGGEELKEYCAKYGIGVTQLPPFYVEDETEPVSSTLIRSAIVSGDMERARKLLGRPFFIKNLVVPGQQIGGKIAVKTINQELHADMVALAKGVYISRTIIDGEMHISMTNVGTRPTVNDGRDVRVETHILDFCSNIYGKEVTVEFLSRIRDEKKFKNLDALKAQLKRDEKTTREYFEKNS